MEIPSISASAYSSTTLEPSLERFLNQQHKGLVEQQFGQAVKDFAANRQQAAQQVNKQPEKKVTARIVKVVIADTNESLPLEKRMLYSGPEVFTDLTDQELFFEIPISDILAKHNELRAKTLDKKQSEKFGRDIFLEPARIRDLRMVVVGIASF